MKPEQKLSDSQGGRAMVGRGDVQALDEKYEDFETEDGTMSARNQAIAYREIMDIKAAANYLGVSRSHLSHILAGKVPRVPVIPHVRAGRRALIRRAVIDRWLLEQENDAATSIVE